MYLQKKSLTKMNLAIHKLLQFTDEIPKNKDLENSNKPYPLCANYALCTNEQTR